MGDINHHRSDVADAIAQHPEAHVTTTIIKHDHNKRVASFDIFRGLTVALMILVEDAGGEWPIIAHAPQNGCNLYVCVTLGAVAIVFSFSYTMVDFWKLRYLFLPLEWIGKNAILVYVMAVAGIFAGFINGWYYDDPHNTLIYWIQKHIFIGVWHSRRVGILLYVIFAKIVFWGIISGILHWLRIYWKL